MIGYDIVGDDESIAEKMRRAEKYLANAIEALERREQLGTVQPGDELSVIVAATELALAKNDGTTAEKLIEWMKEQASSAVVIELAVYMEERNRRDTSNKLGRVSSPLGHVVGVFETLAA